MQLWQYCLLLTSRLLYMFRTLSASIIRSIARAERDGTRAETRFRLSPKRTNPFKSVGAQFSRLLAAEVCASAWLMPDSSRSEMAWDYWLPTPFASFPFTSPPVRHRVPPGSERALLQNVRIKISGHSRLKEFLLHVFSYYTCCIS